MAPISYNNVLLAIFQFPRDPNSMFLRRFCPLTAAIFLMSSFFCNLCETNENIQTVKVNVKVSV